jgi:hypothetical protein
VGTTVLTRDYVAVWFPNSMPPASTRSINYGAASMPVAVDPVERDAVAAWRCYFSAPRIFFAPVLFSVPGTLY